MVDTNNLVQLDNYSEDAVKFLLEMAVKDSVIEIIGVSKITFRPIILKRKHLQEFINNFPNSISLSLHDGIYTHNAFLELPDFQYTHYSCLWVDSVAADKLLSNENPVKNKKPFLSKLKIDENRPSNQSRPKAQKITLELEEIIIDGHIETINLDTLWNCLLQRALNNLSNRYEKGARNTIKDKETLKEWNREEAYYHMKKVLKWFNSF